MLKKKKIFFIAPIFHDYQNAIKSTLEDFGAEVDFYPERSYGWQFKIINNYFHRKLDEYQNKHYLKMLNESSEKEYDYLFVIRGYKISEEFLKGFRDNNPNATLIMYQWDSQKNNEFTHVAHLFDRVYSFDIVDCKLFNLEYLRLFYSQDVKSIIDDKSKPEYDFFFMGSYLYNRYQAMLKFNAYAKENNLTIKSFLYISFTTFIKEAMRGKFLNPSNVSFISMKREKYLDTLKKSKIVIDVSSPTQTGLAMRVIETLASKTKLLTTNKNIVEESYFNENMINFFDDFNPHVNKDFMTSKTESLDGLYCIDEWLKKMFQISE
ncbi:hypothetical protein [Flavobacterium chungangensis]|uniref:Lipopolysaccharide biosynthesis protein n=1 Tax=Flavobacterium chungangensis TaxID=2708132 RepID=A0ABV8ZGU7_9FLAO